MTLGPLMVDVAGLEEVADPQAVAVPDVMDRQRVAVPPAVVVVGDQQPHVVNLPPRPIANVPEKVLEDHGRFQYEPPAGLQRRRDGSQKRHVPLVVQIA